MSRSYSRLYNSFDDDEVPPPPPPPQSLPPPLPPELWDGDDEEDDDIDVPPPPPLPPPYDRRSQASSQRRSQSRPNLPLGDSHGSSRYPSRRSVAAAAPVGTPPSGLSAPMEELKERLRAKIDSKMAGGNFFTSETIAKGQDMWQEMKPHMDILRESAQLAAGSQIQALAGEKLDLGLQMAGEQVRESLIDDEYMPHWAVKWANRLMDVLWPEVHREVHSALMQELGEKLGQYHEPWREDDEPLIQWHDSPRAYLRARFLYNIYPYDQSLWQMVRNPKWCLSFVLSVWPLYGLQPLYWILVFVSIERRDEFQLVNFILEFKALMFLSVGFVCLGIGATQDHICITWSPDRHYCDVIGPGSSHTFLWEIAWFAVQVANVWLAFFYLPFSDNTCGGLHSRSATRSADPYTSGIKRARREPHGLLFRTLDRVWPGGDYSRGGRLWPWVLYDLRCFAACFCLAIVSLLWHGFGLEWERFHKEEWQFRATLWWCKTAYGLLSMPFVVFFVPGLGSALTHVKATGYNRNGRCVRMLTATQRRQKKNAQLEHEREQQYEQEEVLGMLRGLPESDADDDHFAAAADDVSPLGRSRGHSRSRSRSRSRTHSRDRSRRRDDDGGSGGGSGSGGGGDLEAGGGGHARRGERESAGRQREVVHRQPKEDSQLALGHIGNTLLANRHSIIPSVRKQHSGEEAPPPPPPPPPWQSASGAREHTLEEIAEEREIAETSEGAPASAVAEPQRQEAPASARPKRVSVDMRLRAANSRKSSSSGVPAAAL